MLHFDEKTLDRCRSELKVNDPMAVQFIYDEVMPELDIPPEKANLLFHDLLPELVQWFDNILSTKGSLDVMSLICDAIESMSELIEKEDLRALIPFAIGSIKRNKRSVIESMAANILENRTIKYTINDLRKLGFDWEPTGADMLRAKRLYPGIPGFESKKTELITWMLAEIKKRGKVTLAVKLTAEGLVQARVKWPELETILASSRAK